MSLRLAAVQGRYGLERWPHGYLGCNPPKTPARLGVPRICRSLLGRTTFADNYEPTKSKSNNNNNNNNNKSAKGKAKRMVQNMAISLAKKGLNYGAKQVIKRTGGGNGNGTVNVPGQVNINTTVNTTNTLTENFSWTYVPTFAANGTYFFTVFMAPEMLGSTAFSNWSPMLLSSAAKYREFRVKKCIFKLSGGASTTVSGQMLFACSKDPTVPSPSSTEFSYFERSAKLNIATPGSVAALHDSEWHSIRSALMDASETKLFTAGVTFIYFKTPATGIEALKLDVDWTFEFRGRDPTFGLEMRDATVMITENTGQVLSGQVIPSRYPLPRILSTALRQYQLPTGACVARLIRFNKGTGPNEMLIRDVSGADVTASRTLALISSYGSGAATYCQLQYRATIGAAVTTTRPVSVTDVTMFQIAYLWTKDTDYVEILNDTNVGANFAASKFCSFDVDKISTQELVEASTDIAGGVVPTWVGNLPAY